MINSYFQKIRFMCHRCFWGEFLFTRWFWYTLYLNLKLLPFRQARHLPFQCYVKPTILENRGRIEFPNGIKRFMVRVGVQRTPLLPQHSFVWYNEGIVAFKGKCRLGHHLMIQVRDEGYLEFGDQTALNTGSRIVCQKKIVFKYKARTSWDCQFYDTDFHPVIDMVRNKPIKMKSPIEIGERVWIGHNVIVSKGVKLANESIVSSGSVVKKSFTTPNCIIAGNPAEMVDEGFRPDFSNY